MNKQKLTYALTVAAFLGSAAAFPAFADTNTQVAGNGAFSNTQVQSSTNDSTHVSQTNNTTATNNVNVSNNTGNNSASFNTGSNVTMQTGDANANVAILNTAGQNTASVNGGTSGDQNTTVAGNGAFSQTSANTSSNNSTSLSQTNNTNFANKVNVNNNTGKNSADFNTGGSVNINTGTANAMVDVSNTAGSNQATVNGGSGCGCGTGTSTVVAGNGAFSSNNVSSNSNSSTSLNQQNWTNFTNMVNANNNTGKNSADFNTGSNVSINTGSANTWVGITNLAGQNTAFVQGGNEGLGNFISVFGNGAFSNNSVSARNSLRTALEQENLTTVVNYISTMNNTGNNSASFNTGGDDFLTTGNANSGVNVFNTAGSNEAFVISPSFFSNTALTEILGNGAFSNNSVSSHQSNNTFVKQKNNTLFTNSIWEKNNTGHNKSSFSTSFFPFLMSISNCGCSSLGSLGFGTGISSLMTGNANAMVDLSNLASTNHLSF